MSNEMSQLLNEIVIGSHIVPKVAEAAGCAHQTVYSACDGRVNPSIEIIKAAWLVTRDPRLKRALEPAGMVLVPDTSCVKPDKDVAGEGNDVILAAASAIDRFRKRVADGKVSTGELIGTQADLDHLQMQMYEFLAAVDKELKSRVGIKIHPSPLTK